MFGAKGATTTSATSPYSIGDLELDEIISPEMRAAVRKTLAMREMVAAHEAAMARYRAVRRKQEALAAALKARGLLPQSAAGSMASLARYLASPHAVSATLSPQAQVSYGTLLLAQHVQPLSCTFWLANGSRPIPTTCIAQLREEV